MIDQELNLSLLELFDDIEQLSIFKEYKQIENRLMNDSKIISKLNEYHDLLQLQERLSSSNMILDIDNKVEALKKDIMKDNTYQRYLELYDECNDYLNELSKLIFKDIVNEKGDINACCKRKVS